MDNKKFKIYSSKRKILAIIEIILISIASIFYITVGVIYHNYIEIYATIFIITGGIIFAIIMFSHKFNHHHNGKI